MPEALRMAAMADTYDVNVASHNFYGPLANMMCAHFCAVVPNFRIMEFDIDEVPWKRKLLTNPYVIENGAVLLPKGPGWGTDVDEDEIIVEPQHATLDDLIHAYVLTAEPVVGFRHRVADCDIFFLF